MLKKKFEEADLFRSYLPNILNLKHPLCILAESIDWDDLHNSFMKLYCKDFGRPAKSVRLMVGLNYLKYLKNLSDEQVVSGWVENPYWQYFCGEEYFQTEFPIHPTSMTKWRNRLDEEDLSKLLEATSKSGFKTKTITPRSIHKVNVDTTVQEKNIAYPTDINLYYRLIQHLVKTAKSNNIDLKQTYERVGKRLLRKHSGHVHARQMKRAGRDRKKMKTYLGRLYRDLLRKAAVELINDEDFAHLCELVRRGMAQTKTSKNKLYSVHEPHVECICKGKAHKRYEFGCKVGFASTSKEGFIISAVALHGNPYDGHTLERTLSMAEKIVSSVGKLKDIYVDLGYRKHDYTGEAKINIVGRSREKLTKTQRKWYNRRSVVEADIGHMKNDHRLNRNFLKGENGDHVNVMLAACGYNLRAIYRHIVSIFFALLESALDRAKFCQILEKLRTKIYMQFQNPKLAMNTPK